MQLDEVHKRRVEEIMGAMACPKDFTCYKSGFENLSRVTIIGDAELVECLEETPQTCVFGSSFGYGSFCRCPLRCYIAKNFRK